MFHYVTGDLLKSNAQCLVNTVNCEGYMGKGIAYQFKMSFPNNNISYIKACKNGSLTVGTIHTFNENGKLIVNFPTKDKWRAKSKMEYITSGLDALIQFIFDNKINSVAIPPLGSGNGGLIWHDVKQIVEQKMLEVSKNIDIYIYEPSNNYVAKPTIEPKLSLSALILMQMKFHLTDFGKIRLQKTAYLVDVLSGQNYFNFKRDKYGPYDYSIEIVSKNIKEFQRFHNVTTKKAYEIAYQKLTSDTVFSKLEVFSPYIKEVSQIINTLKDKEVECLATIIFLIDEKDCLTNEEIITGFKSWSLDKAKRFTESDISNIIDFAEQNYLICKNLTGYVIPKT